MAGGASCVNSTFLCNKLLKLLTHFYLFFDLLFFASNAAFLDTIRLFLFERIVICFPLISDIGPCATTSETLNIFSPIPLSS